MKTSVVAGILFLFLIGMVPCAVAGDDASGDQGGTILFAAPENGTVWIGSVPTNATIYIDNVNCGLTNTYVANLTAGTHALTLVKVGYQNLSATIDLSPGELLVLKQFILSTDDGSEDGNGTVWIGSIPTNATIYIDGVDKGLTNAYVTNLTAGTRNLTLVKAGYQNLSTTFEVEADKAVVLTTFILSNGGGPDDGNGTVWIGSIPTNATIYIDGVNRGLTNAYVTNLTAGTRNLTLVKAGYQNLSTTFEVEADKAVVLTTFILSNGGGPDDGNGTVWIGSIPTNATIYIDGVNRGLTNAYVTNLTAGTRNLTLVKAGYQNLSTTFEVEADKTVVLTTFILSNGGGPDDGNGTVWIGSIPTNATIYIDGVNRGLTNAYVTNLTAGTRNLTLVKAGYQNLSTTFEVEADKTVVLTTFILSNGGGPDDGNGTVWIGSIPTNATIYIDGVNRGLTNAYVTNLTAGTRNLTLVKAGYQNLSTTFEVEADKTVVLTTFILIESEGPDDGNGTVWIGSIPTNATIYIDGVNWGLTNAYVTNLTAGTRNLTLVKSGYQNLSTTFEVEAGRTMVLRTFILSNGGGPDDGNGTVWIGSIPTNATIYIDGVNRGLTNAYVTNLTAGTRNLTLVKSGYQNLSTTIDVEAGRTMVLRTFILSNGGGPDNGNGTVWIGSIPTNATIYIDGVNRGLTNAYVTNLTAGTRNLTLVKSGYQNLSTTIDVEAGRTMVLRTFILSNGGGPDDGNGTIWIGSIPTNATIYIDGVNRGLTNAYVTNLTAGTRNLTLVKSGYQNLSTTIDVEAGRTMVLRTFILTQGDGPDTGSGTIWIGSVPTRATIYLDGINRGQTDQYLSNVPAGTRNLTLVKAGYQNLTTTVDVKAGKTTVMKAFRLLINP